LSVNDAGLPELPVWFAWKPDVAHGPAVGGIRLLYETFLAVSAPLLGENVAFHWLVMACPLGRVNARVQR
jgi:hypothetical protein